MTPASGRAYAVGCLLQGSKARGALRAAFEYGEEQLAQYLLEHDRIGLEDTVTHEHDELSGAVRVMIDFVSP